MASIADLEYERITIFCLICGLYRMFCSAVLIASGEQRNPPPRGVPWVMQNGLQHWHARNKC